MSHPVHNTSNPSRTIRGLTFGKPHDRRSSFPQTVASMLGFKDIFDGSYRTLDQSIQILKSQPPPPGWKGVYPSFLFWHPLVSCKDCRVSQDWPRLQDLAHLDDIEGHHHQCLFDFIEPMAHGSFRLGQCWKHYSEVCPLGETIFTLDPLPEKDTEWVGWKDGMDFRPEPRAYKLVLFTSDYELHVSADGSIASQKLDEKTLETRKKLEPGPVETPIDQQSRPTMSLGEKRKRPTTPATPTAPPPSSGGSSNARSKFVRLPVRSSISPRDTPVSNATTWSSPELVTSPSPSVSTASNPAPRNSAVIAQFDQYATQLRDAEKDAKKFMGVAIMVGREICEIAPAVSDEMKRMFSSIAEEEKRKAEWKQSITEAAAILRQRNMEEIKDLKTKLDASRKETQLAVQRIEDEKQVHASTSRLLDAERRERAAELRLFTKRIRDMSEGARRAMTEVLASFDEHFDDVKKDAGPRASSGRAEGEGADK